MPLWPTAKTLVGPLPHTAVRSLVVPEGITAHLVPSKRTMVPLAPTAKTLVGPLPHTPLRLAEVPETLVLSDHVCPSWTSTVPP